ncbi:MAG: GDP-mannose 4,6-dehydratase [Pseudomonadota bacterium]
MAEPERIAVIGSNSFSGASFAAHALRKGIDVVGISRSTEPSTALLPYRWETSADRFEFHQLDINHNLDEIVQLLQRERVGHIVNFAAQSMVGQSWEFPEHWFHTNAVSTVMLHNRLRQSDFVERYVHITTPEVYGSTDGFIREDAPYNPSTPYAVSRAAGDMSLKTFVDAYDFPAVSTRAANVYGPGQPLYRIIPRMILFIRLGHKLSLHGGGHSRRSFIHIDDVSTATMRIMTDGDIGETYHISTNEIVSIRELVERICSKMSVDFDEHVEVVGDRLGKDAAYLLDSTKLRERLDWSDAISLDRGLEECIAWVDRYLDELKTLPFDYIHKP